MSNPAGTGTGEPHGDAARLDQDDADRLAAAHGGTDFAGFSEVTADDDSGEAGEGRSATEEAAADAARLGVDEHADDRADADDAQGHAP